MSRLKFDTQTTRLFLQEHPRKTITEIMAFLDSYKIWASEFERRHGRIFEMTHLSGGEDPPDVILTSEQGPFGVEITELQDSKIGHFLHVSNKLMPKDTFRALPNLSNRIPKRHEDILIESEPASSPWGDAGNEAKAWTQLGIGRYQDKRRKTPLVPISWVIMFGLAHLSHSLLYQVAWGLSRSMGRDGPWLILHSIAYETASWLLVPGRKPISVNHNQNHRIL